MSNPILLERSKKMLDEPTPAEAILSDKLKAIRIKFSQQWIIAPYIVDFYIPSYNLIIEVDGKIHQTTKDYDARRDKYLKNKGYKIVRISNSRAFRITYSELRALIGGGKRTKKKKTKNKPKASPKWKTEVPKVLNTGTYFKR